MYRSYDFGYAKPFLLRLVGGGSRRMRVPDRGAVRLHGTPNEGVLWTPEKQFAEIRRIEEEHPDLRGTHHTRRGRPCHLGRQPG